MRVKLLFRQNHKLLTVAKISFGNAWLTTIKIVMMSTNHTIVHICVVHRISNKINSRSSNCSNSTTQGMSNR